MLRSAALTLAALAGGSTLLTAGCASPDGDAPKSPAKAARDLGPADREILVAHTKNLQQYIDAMLLCGSPNPGDWEQAKRQFEILNPFFVFGEDPDLIRRFRAGEEAPRKELARRGVLLRAILVFQQPYDKNRWDDARMTLLDAGEPGQILLVTTLLKMLLNGQHQPVWTHVRYNLVASGRVGLETTEGLLRELAQITPASAPVFKEQDLIQVLMVVIGFGDEGRKTLEQMARHEKPNMRRCVASAIGEAVDASAAPILIRLLSQDPEWTVRTAAAQAMGRMAPARKVAGPALVDRIGKERDGMVLRTVLRALGDLLYGEAVPELMKVLEVPSRETAEVAMSALYIITGERFLRREQWVEWYRTKYPAWKSRRGN